MFFLATIDIMDVVVPIKPIKINSIASCCFSTGISCLALKVPETLVFAVNFMNASSPGSMINL